MSALRELDLVKPPAGVPEWEVNVVHRGTNTNRSPAPTRFAVLRDGVAQLRLEYDWQRTMERVEDGDRNTFFMMADEALCLAPIEVSYGMPGGKSEPRRTPKKLRRIDRMPIVSCFVQSNWGCELRMLALVDTSRGWALADIITGTLYELESGLCMTSTLLCLVDPCA